MAIKLPLMTCADEQLTLYVAIGKRSTIVRTNVGHLKRASIVQPVDGDLAAAIARLAHAAWGTISQRLRHGGPSRRQGMPWVFAEKVADADAGARHVGHFRTWV